MPRTTKIVIAPARKKRAPKRSAKPTIVVGTGAYRPAPRGARIMRISGTGSYSVGEKIGASLGSKLGSFLGGKAHHLIKALTGFGDYRVEENSIMKGGMDPPEVVNSLNNQSTIVRHREYLGDILGSKDFTIDKFPLNPGQQGTFPWLAQIAQSYAEYRFCGLVFEFKSMSSDAVLSTATNSALGTVAMATNYNAVDPDFPDKKSMENYMFGSSAKPSQSFYHPVECKKSWTTGQGLYYVRSSAVNSLPANADLRWYDHGNFYLATQGMQADGGVVGELWVTYEVELRKPRLANGINELTDHWQLANVTNQYVLGSGITLPNCGATLSPGSSLGTTITHEFDGVYTINYIVFPANVTNGTYKIDYSMLASGSATGNTVMATPTIVGGAIDQFYQNDASKFASTQGAPFSVSFNQALQSFVINVSLTQAAPQCKIKMTAYTLPQGGGAVGDLFISQINPLIAT